LKEVQVGASLQYFLANIDPKTGSCNMLRVPASGIVTAMSFDQHNGVLFYHDASDSGNILRTASVRTGATTSLLLQTNFPLSDMAVRFLN
jgi:hypothetical protein